MTEVLGALAEADWLLVEDVEKIMTVVLDALAEAWILAEEVEEPMTEVLDKLAEADWLLVEDVDVSSMTELARTLAELDI